jgi:hypothetical protein
MEKSKSERFVPYDHTKILHISLIYLFFNEKHKLVLCDVLKNFFS